MEQRGQLWGAQLTKASQGNRGQLSCSLKRTQVFHENVGGQKQEVVGRGSSFRGLGLRRRGSRCIGLVRSFEHVRCQGVGYLLYSHLLRATHHLDNGKSGLFLHTIDLLMYQKEKLLSGNPSYLNVTRFLDFVNCGLKNTIQKDPLHMQLIPGRL